MIDIEKTVHGKRVYPTCSERISIRVVVYLIILLAFISSFVLYSVYMSGL